MFPFVSEAFAQDAAGDPGANPIVQFIPFILIFVVFYFLIIRPQQKKQKKHQNMLSALKKGDKVVTTGGIYGTIAKMGDDRLTLEIADKIRIQVERHQVSRLANESAKDSGESTSKE